MEQRRDEEVAHVEDVAPAPGVRHARLPLAVGRDGHVPLLQPGTAGTRTGIGGGQATPLFSID
jgi:hypothetical protein